MNVLNNFQTSTEHWPKKDDLFKSVEPFFREFCKTLCQSEEFKFLDSAEIQTSFLSMIQSDLETLFKRQTPQNIYSEFINGKYDELVFSENPISTKEIETLIASFPQNFIESLFFKCKYKKTLEFWFENSILKLPKNAVCLAVCLGCNLSVLKFLKDKQLFQDIDQKTRKNLLNRGKRFQNEGLFYLAKEFELEI